MHPLCKELEHMGFPKGCPKTRHEQEGKMKHELKILPHYFQAVWYDKKNFEVRKHDRDFRVEVAEAFCMAISALKKQEGKKPIEVKNVYPSEQFECPVCGCCVGRHKTLRKVNDLIGEVLTDCKVEFNFCPDCGQRIDWSDEHGTD